MTFGRTSRDSVTITEYEAYIITMNELEERIENDSKYPIIEDKIKKYCKNYIEP